MMCNTGGSAEDYAAAVGLLTYDVAVSSGVGLPHSSLPQPSAYAALLQVRFLEPLLRTATGQKGPFCPVALEVSAV
jgi:hypothetical protein